MTNAGGKYKKQRIVFIISLILLFTAHQKHAARPDEKISPQKVNIVPVEISINGEITDSAVAQDGKLHVLYTSNQNLYYCIIDENKKCAEAVRVNEDENAVSGSGEATPKMAVTADGKIFATWYQMPQWPKSQIYVASSSDGGKTFSTPDEISGDVDPPNVLPNIAVDKNGNPAVVWLGGGSNPHGVTTHLYMARSGDGGENFSIPEKINPSGTDVCGCCLPYPQFDSESALIVAYRDATNNVRDIRVKKIINSEKTNDVAVVSHDNWILNACPNSGPRLAVYNTVSAVAWRSKNQPLMALSSNAAENFSEKLALNFKVNMNSNPSIVKSKEGNVAVAWREDNTTAWVLSAQEFSFPAYLVTDNGIFEIKK